MKKILFIACYFLINTALAQNFSGGFIPYPNTIRVNQNNKNISMPFGGGFDVPQFSACDLDFDGKKDIVIFDREGGKVSCYLNKGMTGQIAYEYAPQYAAKFPKKLIDWMLLVDYNGDGKEDIFTAIPGGVKIYKNTSTALNGISFSLVNGDVQADFGSFVTRLYSSPADIPAIIDADDDGDGIPTSKEMPDPDKDGYVFDAVDADGDLIPDYLEPNAAKIDDEIEVYNAVTANGDGINDVLVIRNIGLYPDNELTITNRWGDQVYQTRNYGSKGNFFQGRHQKNYQELPAGIYFYVLQYRNQAGVNQQKQGYLYLTR